MFLWFCEHSATILTGLHVHHKHLLLLLWGHRAIYIFMTLSKERTSREADTVRGRYGPSDCPDHRHSLGLWKTQTASFRRMSSPMGNEKNGGKENHPGELSSTGRTPMALHKHSVVSLEGLRVCLVLILHACRHIDSVYSVWKLWVHKRMSWKHNWAQVYTGTQSGLVCAGWFRSVASGCSARIHLWARCLLGLYSQGSLWLLRKMLLLLK